VLIEYTSKPVTVLACKIEEEGKVEKCKKAGVYCYTHKGKGAVSTKLDFTVATGQKPEAGDYIIYLDAEDIYLCKADVFDKKYGVKGMIIK